MSLRPSAHFRPVALESAPIDPVIDFDAATGDVYLEPGSKAEVKYVPFSPLEEYQIREGETEALHEEFHAVLCNDWRGSGTVKANGILIKDARFTGPQKAREGVKYWSADSPLCTRPADGPIEVFYTFNPSRPEVVHLWDRQWRYLESLPRFDKPGVLDFPSLAKEGREKARQIARFTEEMQRLHADESLREVNDARHNAAEMSRVANLLEIPEEAAPRARSKRAASPVQGDAFTRAGRNAEAVIESHHRHRALIDEVEADLVQIRHHRLAEVFAEAEDDVLDPLDAL